MEVLNGPAGVWIAAILTVMVYSYLLGDNPLYRLAEHLLVGSAIAYAVVVAVHSVLIPRLFARLGEGQWLYLIPLILGVLLLAKFRPSWSGLGGLPMSILFGVGAALALSGALFGTIEPQVRSAVALSLNPSDHSITGWFGVLNALIITVGTICTLSYFRFSVGRADKQGKGLQANVTRLWSRVGRWALMIAFGAIFASLVMSRASLFIGRMQFLLSDWLHVIRMP